MKFKLILSCLLAGASLFASEEEPDKLDLVLAELTKLNEGLRRVEDRMDKLENQIVSVSVDAVQSASDLGPGEESSTFIDRVVEAVQVREERVNFPWMDISLWSTLEEGMTPSEVVAILGEPTMEDPSLHKRIDYVYTYSGRKPATNERLTGKVKFYRDKIVQIEAP